MAHAGGSYPLIVLKMGSAVEVVSHPSPLQLIYQIFILLFYLAIIGFVIFAIVSLFKEH